MKYSLCLAVVALCACLGACHKRQTPAANPNAPVTITTAPAPSPTPTSEAGKTLRRPLDRTHEVIDQVKKSRAEDQP